MISVHDILILFTALIFLVFGYFYISQKQCVADLKKQIQKLKQSELNFINLLKETKDQEEQYEKVIELMPDALFIHKGEIPVKANSAAFQLMKCDRDSCPIDRLTFNIHPDDQEIAEKRLEKLMSVETVVPFAEEKMILENGEVIYVESSGASYMYKGEMYIVTVVRDIGERKRNERLMLEIMEKNHQLAASDEYDKIRTDYFTTISHELRTPLNILFGTIQLQMQLHETRCDCGSNTSCKKYIKMMRQNCYRLLRLTNNLIDLTKVDSGFAHLNLSKCNIVDAVERITESVIDFAGNFGITVLFHSEIRERIVDCDLDKLERILLNLLSNAIKFTNRWGFIEVKLKDAGDFLQISVKDTGIGIPEDKKRLIFERFGQVDSSFTRTREGTGIGLPLVKALVELQGGNISFTSEIGRGSEFVFTLPAGPAVRNPADHQPLVKKDINVEKLMIEFSDIYAM